MEITNVVGYRFSPTDEELINHYLMNKILGKSWLVDDEIREINICGYKPKFLPSLSKIKSEDLVWYFFSPIEFLPTKKTVKKKVTKRTTPSGFWKPTGKDREIKDRRGNGAEIGIKKTLVFHQGKAANGVRTPWVMHEYHITPKFLADQKPYVICKIKYKGKAGDILYGNNSSELSDSNLSDWINTYNVPEVGQLDQQDNNRLSLDDLSTPTNQQEALYPFDTDMVSSNYNNPCVQPQYPDDDEVIREFIANFQSPPQVDYNNHRPKKSSTWTIPKCSSDSDDSSSESDAESISATSYQGISSSGDSDGSSSRPFHTRVDEIPLLSKDSCKYAKTSINRKTWKSHFTRRTPPSKQEMNEGKSKAVDAFMDKKSSSSMVKTEKKGWFITEKAKQKNRKNPPYINLMNMIMNLALRMQQLAICQIEATNEDHQEDTSSTKS